jgi:hypothetical protein
MARSIFEVILKCRLPMSGGLRRIYQRLGLCDGPSVVILQAGAGPSRNDLIILRRSDFEDYLGRLPASPEGKLK